MTSSAPIIVWGVGTPRTLRVHWALAELQLEYEIESIKTRTESMDRNDFLAVSPGRKIPALSHGGIELTESGAIVRYLMREFDRQAWDAAAAARRDRWTFFALTEIDATALYVIRRHAGLPEIYGEAPLAVTAARDYATRQLRRSRHRVERAGALLVRRAFQRGRYSSRELPRLGQIDRIAAAANARRLPRPDKRASGVSVGLCRQ